MGLLSFLFGKRRERVPRIKSILHQALTTVNSLASANEQRELAEGIEQTVQELINANQAARSGLTLAGLEMNMVAVAQSIGLMVWEHFGRRLSREKCVPLAQGLVILELYIQQTKIPEGNLTHEWYEKAIAEQVLATQASMPVVLGFMGQEDQARQMVAATVEAAKLPTDEDVVQALQRISTV